MCEKATKILMGSKICDSKKLTKISAPISDFDDNQESDVSESNDDMGRVLIFCRKYTEVTALYFFFKHTLKECFIYPAGSPDYIQNRHSCNVVFDVQKFMKNI